MMMIGTIDERGFGAPTIPRPLGPIQPSAPVIQTMETNNPTSVNTRSEIVRMNRRISRAINNSARPINGATPVSVPSMYSSSITANETLLTDNGPSLAIERSLIRRSMSFTVSSSVFWS